MNVMLNLSSEALDGLRLLWVSWPGVEGTVQCLCIVVITLIALMLPNTQNINVCSSSSHECLKNVLEHPNFF